MRSSLHLAFILAVAVSVGCQQQVVPTGTKPRTTKPKPSPSASATVVKPTTPVNQHIPLSEPQRIIDLTSNTVELIGKVKLVSKVKIISDNGASIISDNGASIISNNGGTIISDNGASIIGNNGGAIISDNGASYVVMQAGGTSAVPEASLADAQIEVLDAAGHVLVDKDKKPITATSDKQGNYSLKAALPSENLILRVRLFNGGQLFAITTKDQRTDTINIDTASSLGTAYVLDKYVKKKQTVFDKLPGLEAEKLQADMDAARIHVAGEALAMQPAELIEVVDKLRAKEAKLEQTIKRIEAILLAGQANLGEGLPANQVSLGTPTGIFADTAGNFYISEGSAARIRKVAPDGKVSAYLGPGAPAGRDEAIGKIGEMIGTPDGTMYLINDILCQVLKIGPDGQRTVIAGAGEKKTGPTGGPAATTHLYEPRELALSPDGTLHILEHGDLNSPPRLLYVDAQKNLQQIAFPTSPVVKGATGMAIDKDGTIWVYAADGDQGNLIRKKLNAAWETIKANISGEGTGHLDFAPDGTLYFTLPDENEIYTVSPTGELTRFAGTGENGYTGDGGPAAQALLNNPKAVWGAPDGTIYIADKGNSLIRKVKNGTISTFAGVQGLNQVGDALAVAINQPGGLTVDDQNRLVVSDSASHTIKRLDGQVLTRIAGTQKGFSGDGGAAALAQLDGPGSLAYFKGELFFLDCNNSRIRKIDANGFVTTIAGIGQSATFGAELKVPAMQAKMQQPTAMAVSPEGDLYWTDSEDQMILRLKDGFVERVAGTPGSDAKGADGGDGGPATSAKLSGPTAITFDKDGNLYFSDSGNLRIRKIDKAGIITTFAGVPISQALAVVFSGKAAGADGDPAKQTILWGPAGLAFDTQGNLFMAEAGTANAGAVGGANLLGEGLGGALPADLIPKTYARIRKITPDGKIYNVTGPGTSLLGDTSGDNMLLFPAAIAFDKDGRLVIADAGLNQLKVLPKGSF